MLCSGMPTDDSKTNTPASNQSSVPQWSAKHLRAATAAAGVALWSWNVHADAKLMDQRGYDLWSITGTSHVTFEQLSAQLHPEDSDRIPAAFRATRAVVGDYEIDFRIVVDNEVRWLSARGQGDDEGIAGGVMYGVFLNVTRRKQAEEAHELLAGEMSHRVKNLLHLASGLARVASRSAVTKEDMVRDLTNRLSALGRAHDLVRAEPGGESNAARLGDLLAILLAPYDDLKASRSRVRVSVPKMGVGEDGATALALVIHELATNAIKYGALLVPTGMLDVSGASHGSDVVVVWAERGGPPVVAPTSGDGFGSKMLHQSMSNRLGGAISFDWLKEGTIVTLRMDKDRLAA